MKLPAKLIKWSYIRNLSGMNFLKGEFLLRADGTFWMADCSLCQKVVY